MSSSNPPTDSVSITMAKDGGLPDSYIVSNICLHDSCTGAHQRSAKVMLKETSDQPTHIRWVKKLEDKYSTTEVLCKIGFEYQSKSY